MFLVCFPSYNNKALHSLDRRVAAAFVICTRVRLCLYARVCVSVCVLGFSVSVRACLCASTVKLKVEVGAIHITMCVSG